MSNLNRYTLFFLFVVAVNSSGFCVSNSLAEERPNIVYIMANDLGWRDLGVHGGRLKTPNIDRLSNSGARLEGFYTTPYSSSARAALMTGRYPYRFGLQMMSILPWSKYGIPDDERLLPQALNLAGYRTAMFGSWLLGHADRKFLPTQKGFDYFYGHLTQIGDHFEKINSIGQMDWFEGEKQIDTEGYATDLIAEKTSKFISQHDFSKPLFAMVSFPAPASPIQAPPELIEFVEKAIDSYNIFVGEEAKVTNLIDKTYLAMVIQLDRGIGEIIDALEEKGVRENTIIVFHSDNGGAVKRKHRSGDGDVSRTASDNGPFRSGSGSYYEGGVRVPAILSWPNKIKPIISTDRIHVTDMYPSLLEAANSPITKDLQVKTVDGKSILPMLLESKPNKRTKVILNVNEFGGAILVDNWKLIVRSSLPPQVELYNIGDDPSEETDIASRYPEIVNDLNSQLIEASWEMVPSLYLEDLKKARDFETPMFWGDNPTRP